VVGARYDDPQYDVDELTDAEDPEQYEGYADQCPRQSKAVGERGAHTCYDLAAHWPDERLAHAGMLPRAGHYAGISRRWVRGIRTATCGYLGHRR
jgi:hypothetical protein